MQVTTARSRGDQPEALYDLKGISRVYGTGATAVRALDEIDLRIEVGEFAVIVGSSGSGKSTLLQLLGALDRPTDGRIDFEGRDLARASDRDLSGIRLRTVGFVFQQFNLIPTLTAAPERGAGDGAARARRLRAVGAGARDARARRPFGPRRPSAVGAIGRRAAARRDRPRARQRARCPARRRADRQPRLEDRRGGPSASLRALAANRDDGRADHP